MSFTSDWLFPPFQSREIVDALVASKKSVSYCNVRTDCGHDAFLLPNQLETYGGLIRAFLDNLASVGRKETPHSVTLPAHTSIFRHHRLDYETIADLIPPEASVLDLGCGSGGLLARLRQRGHRRLMGVEWDERAILSCVRRGLDVVHADLNQGLNGFADGQFDFVVLSQTLQTVMDVTKVLREMLRVGRRGIVSFPNIAYRAWRTELAEQGRAPRIHAERDFQWHNTPYVRSLSIDDFEGFCREQNIAVEQRIALDTTTNAVVEDNPNLNADVAVVVISNQT